MEKKKTNIKEHEMQIPEKVFNPFYETLLSLPCGRVLEFVDGIRNTVRNGDPGNLVVTKNIIEKACVFISNNVAYAKCAHFLNPISSMLQTQPEVDVEESTSDIQNGEDSEMVVE